MTAVMVSNFNGYCKMWYDDVSKWCENYNAFIWNMLSAMHTWERHDGM